MTAHVHTWTPAEGVMARYRCACGAWGIRQGAGSMFRRAGGPVVAMKSAPMFAEGPAITARPSALGAAVADVGPARDVVRISDGRQTRRAPRSR
ncbi:MAG: hypothetical protein VW547_09750 [Alphaproteobacteria bacterium]